MRSRDAARLDPRTLFDAAAEADVVLLGEKHDNPRHHELELRMVYWTTSKFCSRRTVFPRPSVTSNCRV